MTDSKYRSIRWTFYRAKSASKTPRRTAMPKPKSKRSEKSDVDKSRASDFMCRTEFCTSLPSPDAYMLPKTLDIPLDPERLFKWRGASLDLATPTQLPLDPLVAIPIDIIDPDAYASTGEPVSLHPADKRLLRKPRSSVARVDLGNELDPASMPFLKSDKWAGPRSSKTPVLFNQKEKTNARVYSTRERAEMEFKATQTAPVHFTNPDLQAVQVIPLFPYQHDVPFSHIVGDKTLSQPQCSILGTDASAGVYTSEGKDSSLLWTAQYRLERVPLQQSEYLLVVDVEHSSASWCSLSDRLHAKKKPKVHQFLLDLLLIIS